MEGSGRLGCPGGMGVEEGEVRRRGRREEGGGRRLETSREAQTVKTTRLV
jgi:hypothetical protein